MYENLLDRIEQASVASCTCGVKAPNVLFHETDCRYRVLQEAWSVINNVKDAVNGT